MEPSDLDLWRAAAAGDHGAFATLVQRHAPALFRTALALCGERCDAEDACQEAFIAAFRGLRDFAGRASVKTWLTRIVIRRAARAYKIRRRQRRLVSLSHRAGDWSPPSPQPPGALAGEPSVPAATSTVDRRLDLLEVIRSLPVEFREAIILRELQGLSYQEIAQVLQVPCGTVESRLHRGRAELRRRLAGY